MSSNKVVFTAKRIADFKCAPEKQQDFLWDADPKASGLGLRVKGNGRPTFIFQGRYAGKPLRITIGRPGAWSISEARARAREIQAQIDVGRDPRVLKAEVAAQDEVRLAEMRLEGLTVAQAWQAYIQERRPFWSDNHYNSHVRLAQKGGLRRQRSKELTKQGPLYSLLSLRLVDISSTVLKEWAQREAKVRPSSARLSLRLFKAFLRWLDEQPGYRGKFDVSAADGKRIREILGPAPARKTALRREQLEAWFLHVRAIPNPVIGAYLQALLLTGVRREELAKLKWNDVDLRWKTLKLADKYDKEGKEIPLTPYVSALIRGLPRRNEWVFSSQASQSGRIIDPKSAHRKACEAAGLQLSIHDLRRSFKSLAEWLDIPTGVIAQIMGHRPSATAEKHYTVRPVDMLRIHHEKLESWILKQAVVSLPADEMKGNLRVVN